MLAQSGRGQAVPAPFTKAVELEFDAALRWNGHGSSGNLAQTGDAELSLGGPRRARGKLTQAFSIQYLVDHWNEVEGMQDLKMSRLAGRLGRPLLYHSPSLVEHVGTENVWGGVFHKTADIDRFWKA